MGRPTAVPGPPSLPNGGAHAAIPAEGRHLRRGPRRGGGAHAAIAGQPQRLRRNRRPNPGVCAGVAPEPRRLCRTQRRTPGPVWGWRGGPRPLPQAAPPGAPSVDHRRQNAVACDATCLVAVPRCCAARTAAIWHGVPAIGAFRQPPRGGRLPGGREEGGERAVCPVPCPLRLCPQPFHLGRAHEKGVRRGLRPASRRGVSSRRCRG